MTHPPAESWPQRVAILGVGLLGGSVALALRRRGGEVTIVGTARRQSKCDQLMRAGIVDSATTSLERACAEADVIVAAGPVDTIAATVIEAARCSADDALLTDVGSTKAQIAAAVGAAPSAARKFVPAHPIAGSEKTGFQHASAELFDGKVIVLTPTPQVDPEQVVAANRFWGLTGGVLQTLSPADHDAHLAAVSHVPHLISALVARLATPVARGLAGSGWEDITRVAAGDPRMWTAICQQNREAIEGELQRFDQQLQMLRQTLQSADGRRIERWLAEAQRIKQPTPPQD